MLAYVAALVPAIAMAVTQPVWSLVDEAQHFDFIVQLSHGAYPAVGSTPIAPETLQIAQATGVYRAFYPPGTYPAPDLTDDGAPPAGMSERANAAWMQRHMWQISHETVQTPLYYLAMVPVFWSANAVGGPLTAVYVLRLINALIIAVLAPLAVALARILTPARPEIAALAALLAVLLPGLDLNGTRISNDALATALGGVLVLLAVSWAGDVWSWRRTALIGLLFGAALMVKITDAGLFPALVASTLWPGPGMTRPARLARVVATAAVAGLCLVPWFAVNLHSYGAFTPGALASRWSDALPGPLSGSFVMLDLAVFVLTYWTGEPWGALPLAGLMAAMGALIALTVPVAYVRLARGRLPGVAAGPLAVATAAVAGMIGVSLLLPVTARFEFVGPGRYVYPALPAAAAICALGITTVIRRAGARQILAAAYAALAVLMLGLASAGFPRPDLPGGGSPPPTAQVVNARGAAATNELTITVDRVAFDGAAGAMWIEVVITNAAAGEVEWSPTPTVSAGGASANGEYLRSTHLPGDLDPGQNVTGWLYVPLNPAMLRGWRTFHVHFADVAVAGYQTLADIDFDVTLAGGAE